MPRMTVTFNQDLYDAIDRLARVQGVTKSSIINEYMGVSVPVMHNIANIIEHLRTATDAEKQAFKDDLQGFGGQVVDDFERLKGQLEMFTCGSSLLKVVKTHS